ncbi:MAG: hypothetical protein GY935_25760 [Gammaproteobacteria bacterium]|nr:hypothetical protein [Gammaproteobacteria bacterium]
MPRKARILVPNCPHHIVQRGHNRKAVFLAAEDYQYYLQNLDEWVKELDVKLCVWCLMLTISTSQWVTNISGRRNYQVMRDVEGIG